MPEGKIRDAGKRGGKKNALLCVKDWKGGPCPGTGTLGEASGLTIYPKERTLFLPGWPACMHAVVTTAMPVKGADKLTLGQKLYSSPLKEDPREVDVKHFS